MTYTDLVTALSAALEQHNPALAAGLRANYGTIYQMLDDAPGEYPSASDMEAVYWLVDQLLNGLPADAALAVAIPATVS